jgi:hypothetical protein
MKRIILATLVVAGPLISGTSARAILIKTSDYGIGMVLDGTPANATAELQYIQLLVKIWDGTASAGTYQVDNHSDTFAALSGGLVPASLTAPATAGSDSEQFTSNDNSATINLGNGAQFLLTKWGGGDILYYVGGLSGSVTVQNDQVKPGQSFTSLSHFQLLGASVADGGSTLALLGSVMLGITWARSKFARN